MIDQLWNFVAHQLITNQFFSAAALSGVLMSALYTLKSVPMRIWRRLERYLMFRTFITENDFLADALNDYIAVKYPQQLRNVEVRTSNSTDVNMSHDNDYIHVWYKGRRLRISKTREKLENASQSFNRYVRNYSISGLLAKSAIKNFILQVMEYKNEKDRRELQEKKKSARTHWSMEIGHEEILLLLRLLIRSIYLKKDSL